MTTRPVLSWITTLYKCKLCYFQELQTCQNECNITSVGQLLIPCCFTLLCIALCYDLKYLLKLLLRFNVFNILLLTSLVLSKRISNCIGGVMVSMLASSAVDRGFAPRSGQTKTIKLVFVAFPLYIQH